MSSSAVTISNTVCAFVMPLILFGGREVRIYFPGNIKCEEKINKDRAAALDVVIEE